MAEVQSVLVWFWKISLIDIYDIQLWSILLGAHASLSVSDLMKDIDIFIQSF